MRRGAVVLTVALTCLLPSAAATFLVVAPDQDEVTAVDVVIVLAGDEASRLDRGLQLLRDGYARALAISSVASDLHAPRTTKLCRRPPAGVVCFRPDPVRTRGEARVLGELARQEGWRTGLLVTSRRHVTRARLLVGRCFPGDVGAVGVGESGPLSYRLSRLPREVGGLVATQFDRGC